MRARSLLQLLVVTSVTRSHAQTQPSGSTDVDQLIEDAEVINLLVGRIITENKYTSGDYGRVLEEYDGTQTETENLYKENDILEQSNQHLRRVNQQLKSEIVLLNDVQEHLEEQLTRLRSRVALQEDELLETSTRDCAELYSKGIRMDGVYPIHPDGLEYEVDAWCDMTTEGGGWTTFLLRDRSFDNEDFETDWFDYDEGFGYPSEEYWLGLDALYYLTQRCPYHLRAEVTHMDGEMRWAQWAAFSLDDSSSNYMVSIGDYDPRSTLGNVLTGSWSQSVAGQMFSTYDIDNDQNSGGSCSELMGGGGGWWYNRCSSIFPTAPHGTVQSTVFSTYFWTPGERGRSEILSKAKFMVKPSVYANCFS